MLFNCSVVTVPSCVCRYWKSIGLLLKHVQAHPEVLWWPWTEYHVLQGEMERSYLSFLLTCDPYIAVLGGSERISVIQVLLPCGVCRQHNCVSYSLPMAVFRILPRMS